MELRWMASVSTSSLRAAEAVANGRPCVDEAFAAAVAEPARRLEQELRAVGLPAARLWETLAGLSALLENNRELAESALRKVAGREAAERHAGRLAGAIADLERAALQHAPQLVDELALRLRPLLDQWEARGPGLLRLIVQRTDERLLAPRADIVGVLPVSGGGGSAYLPGNLVIIEAVLANPVGDLPEVLRLAWLLSQLNLDVPALGEAVPRDRLAYVAERALLPAVLEAAGEVELSHYDDARLGSALAQWPRRPVASEMATEPNAEAEIIADWWATFRESSWSFPAALAALDKMLSDSNAR